ncbi:MAG: hypothetical protein AMXMBFR53_21520 [Gemmatimonadota bacterium]
MVGRSLGKPFSYTSLSFIGLLLGGCAMEVVEPPAEDPWVIHVAGTLVDGDRPVAGGVVEVWATRDIIYWGKTGLSAVTDEAGVYRFDITEGAACAREPVTGGWDMGWVVAPYWEGDGFPGLYAKSLVPAALCRPGSIAGPTLQALCTRQAGPNCPPLPSPEMVAPSSEASFDHLPRMTTFVWRSVPDAALYFVDWAYGTACTSNPIACSTWTSGGRLSTSDTTVTIDFVGAQPGRWRVMAQDGRPRDGAWSGYRTFRYTR